MIENSRFAPPPAFVEMVKLPSFGLAQFVGLTVATFVMLMFGPAATTTGFPAKAVGQELSEFLTQT